MERQFEEWVKGNPTHNKERVFCCPDFSCCQPALLAPEEVRRKFRDADEKTQIEMVMDFLRAALAFAGSEGVEQ